MIELVWRGHPARFAHRETAFLVWARLVMINRRPPSWTIRPVF